MTKEFIGIVTTIVLLIGLLGSVSTGVWWVSQFEARIDTSIAELNTKLDTSIVGLDTRLDSLESDGEWKAEVDSTLSVHKQRWLLHFQLWGDSIERKTRELHIRSAPAREEIGGVGE